MPQPTPSDPVTPTTRRRFAQRTLLGGANAGRLNTSQRSGVGWEQQAYPPRKLLPNELSTLRFYLQRGFDCDVMMLGARSIMASYGAELREEPIVR